MRAFFLGDNVDTDQILPGYAMSYPADKLGEVALAGSEIPDFAKEAEPGDIVIAGANFGCGSSREQAPAALKACGVGAVIAGNFARIFRRNAINIGLPVVACACTDKIRKEARPGNKFAIDIAGATLKNETRGKTYPLIPLAKSALETLEAGGLIERVRERLRADGRL